MEDANLKEKNQQEATVCLDDNRVSERCKYCGEPMEYKKNGDYIYNPHLKCEKTEKYKNISKKTLMLENNIFEKAIHQSEAEEKIYNVLKKYIEVFEKAKNEGLGIIFMGKPGTGKTFASSCMANALIKERYAVMSFTLSRYLKGIKKNYSENDNENDIETEILDLVKDADLIILDDVGSERLTDWSKEKIYDLFEVIYSNNKPIIITTNLTGEEISEYLKINGSYKISDRLKELCKGIIFSWESRRKEMGNNKWKNVFGESENV